jgi:hypothetical protein
MMDDIVPVQWMIRTGKENGEIHKPKIHGNKSSN